MTTTLVRHCWHQTATDDADCCWCMRVDFALPACPDESPEHAAYTRERYQQRQRAALVRFLQQQDSRTVSPW